MISYFLKFLCHNIWKYNTKVTLIYLLQQADLLWHLLILIYFSSIDNKLQHTKQKAAFDWTW